MDHAFVRVRRLHGLPPVNPIGFCVFRGESTRCDFDLGFARKTVERKTIKITRDESFENLSRFLLFFSLVQSVDNNCLLLLLYYLITFAAFFFFFFSYARFARRASVASTARFKSLVPVPPYTSCVSRRHFSLRVYRVDADTAV